MKMYVRRVLNIFIRLVFFVPYFFFVCRRGTEKKELLLNEMELFLLLENVPQSVLKNKFSKKKQLAVLRLHLYL